ncbi:Fc receptor-like protein 6 isoform X3 [Ailuropoda melanoleuca]|uniref:Fc receptor-like protein 6 isoform X3 n=1 Tax=Ailuropoda melanoleuca TaxID=9646 RepID=UPI001493EBA2|nr:Fc receptor-like protein 6 isoform X3 [Ailuropoda melanoleuca]
MSLLCARPDLMLLCRIVLFFVPCVGQTGWLYLRTWPNPVFEGDTLTLQCQGWKNTALSQVQFYKDRKLLHNPKAKWFLPMGTATLKSSGQYSCAGKMTFIPHLGTQRSEMTTVQVQELFPPPVLSAVPSPELREGSPLTLRCQTELHPQRSASRLLFSFHKDGHTLQNWGPHSELCLPGAQEGTSGLYWCQATHEGSRVQKQSPQLEVRVQGPRGLSALTSSHWLVPCLSASLLGVLVIATALVAYFRPWRKPGPLPSRNLPPAPGGEQHQLYANVTQQNENEEDDIYSSVTIVPKESEAGPAESASGTWDASVIYTEVKCSRCGEVPDRGLKTRSRTHKAPLGNFEEVLYY